MLGLVALRVVGGPATASARPGGGRARVQTIVGVLATVSKGRVTIASTAGGSTDVKDAKDYGASAELC